MSVSCPSFIEPAKHVQQISLLGLASAWIRNVSVDYTLLYLASFHWVILVLHCFTLARVSTRASTCRRKDDARGGEVVVACKNSLYFTKLPVVHDVQSSEYGPDRLPLFRSVII